MRQGLRSLTKPCDGRKGAKLPGWGLRAERALWGRRSPLVTGCSRSSHWPAPRWWPARILRIHPPVCSPLPRGPPAQTVPGSEKSGDSLRGARLRTEGTRGPGGAGSFLGPCGARGRPPGPSPFPGLPPPAFLLPGAPSGVSQPHSTEHSRPRRRSRVPRLKVPPPGAHTTGLRDSNGNDGREAGEAGVRPPIPSKWWAR